MTWVIDGPSASGAGAAVDIVSTKYRSAPRKASCRRSNFRQTPRFLWRIIRPVKVKAAVAWEAGRPLEIEQIELEGPKPGECLVRLAATGVCHTDAYTLSGKDPEGLFPVVLGHEGAGEVVEVGAGVRSLAVGDHVIPL